MAYQKKVPDSVWFQKDRAMDAAVALKAAVKIFIADKSDNRTVGELSDELYLWLRKRREGGHPKEGADKGKVVEEPF